jgi:hypothetical protein
MTMVTGEEGTTRKENGRVGGQRAGEQLLSH